MYTRTPAQHKEVSLIFELALLFPLLFFWFILCVCVFVCMCVCVCVRACVWVCVCKCVCGQLKSCHWYVSWFCLSHFVWIIWYQHQWIFFSESETVFDVIVRKCTINIFAQSVRCSCTVNTLSLASLSSVLAVINISCMCPLHTDRHTCMHVHMHTHTQTHMHTHKHTYIPIHVKQIKSLK